MTENELYIYIFGGAFLIVNLAIVPLNVILISQLKEKLEKEMDKGERKVKKMFQALYELYSWTTGIVFLPSILISLGIVSFMKSIKNKKK